MNSLSERKSSRTVPEFLQCRRHNQQDRVKHKQRKSGCERKKEPNSTTYQVVCARCIEMTFNLILVVLSGFPFFLDSTLASFIKFDPNLDPALINRNKIFLNRKERFIKFETNDNELEIELGISIPFVKVPLVTGRGLYDEDHEGGAEISINTPGVIVAGMLMLTSFVIIPLLFTATPAKRFGFQRSEDSKDFGLLDQYWTMLQNLDNSLSRKGINSSSCMQKSLCWIARKSEGGERGSPADWISYLLGTWWFKRLTGTDFYNGPEQSCATRYAECSLTPDHFQSFVQMVKTENDGRHGQTPENDQTGNGSRSWNPLF